MTEQLRDRRKHKFVVIDNPVLSDTELSDAAFRLYCVLIRYAGNDSGCWPGITKLAQDMGKGETTVKRLLGELTTRGLISRQRRFKRSSVTWIEDISGVYNQPKNGLYTKNGLSPKMGCAIQPESGLTELDLNIDIIDADVVSLLISFGLDALQAEKLSKQGVSLELANAWIEYAKRHPELKNKQGFVVSRLRDGNGEYPPTETGKGQGDTSRYISGEYADLIQH